MATLELAINARKARSGAREFSRAGREVRGSARGAAAGVTGLSTALKGANVELLAFARARIGIGRFVAAFAAYLTIQKALSGLKGTADDLDRIAKTSRTLGISTEFLSGLGFAAERSGAEVKALEVGFQRLARRMGQFADTGTGPAADTFRALGSDIEEMVKSGVSLEEFLPVLRDRLAEVEDQNVKLAIAQKLVDSEGVQPLLKVLPELGDLLEEAGRRGLLVTPEQAASAEKFNDALTNLRATLTGLARGVGSDVFPKLTEFLTSIDKWVSDNREDIRDFFAVVVPQSVLLAVEAFSLLAKGILEVQQAWIEFQLYWERNPVPAPLRFGIFGAIGGLFPKDSPELQKLLADAGSRIANLDATRKVVNDLRRRTRDWATGGGGAGAGAPPVPDVPKLEGFIPIGPVDYQGGLATRGFVEAQKLAEEMSNLVMWQRELAQTEIFTEDEVRRIQELGAGFAQLREAGYGGEAAEAIFAISSALEQLRQEGQTFEVLRGGIIAIADSLQSRVVGAFVDFVDITRQGKFEFREFANAIIKDLARIFAQMTLLKAVGAIGGALGGAIFGGLGGSSGVEYNTDIGYVKMQHGGVVEGGSPQLVLSHPPEAFVPLKNGAIPVQLQGGAGGGAPINITQQFIVNAVDAKSIDAKVLETIGRQASTVAAAVAGQFRRDPRLRSSFQEVA